MPDRELTEAEIQQFVTEHKTGVIFSALDAFGKEEGKPSLHDLCILELQARLDAQVQVLIEQGRELKALKEMEKNTP